MFHNMRGPNEFYSNNEHTIIEHVRVYLKAKFDFFGVFVGRGGFSD